jgi:hypothetical protein
LSLLGRNGRGNSGRRWRELEKFLRAEFGNTGAAFPPSYTLPLQDPLELFGDVEEGIFKIFQNVDKLWLLIALPQPIPRPGPFPSEYFLVSDL